MSGWDRWWTDGAMVNIGGEGDEGFVADALTPADATRLADHHNQAMTEAEARADALDVDALAKVEHGLDILHSPHFGWGCNAQNCSGQEALDIVRAILAERQRREYVSDADYDVQVEPER